MKRLRILRFLCFSVLVILAGVASVRALFPAEFVIVAANGPSSQTKPCPRAMERLNPVELPAERHRRQCDRCLSPMGHAPVAWRLVQPPWDVSVLEAPDRSSAQVELVSLQPLRSARTAPHA